MIKFKNYYLLLFGSIVLFILALTAKKDSIDVNIGDTYYVMAYNHFYGLLSFFLVLFFILYGAFDLLKIILFKLISKIHIFGSLFSILVLVFPYSIFNNPNDFPLFDNLFYINIALVVSFLLFLILQLLFIMNIFVSLIKKVKTLSASR